MTAFEPGWGQFAKVAVAHLLAVASPGPDFAMVVKQSLGRGRRAAVWTSIGIGTALLVHVAYSMLGIGLLLRSSPAAFALAKYAAAAYLAWIGLKALGIRMGGKAEGPAARAEAPATGGVSDGEDASAAQSSSQAWVTGFLTNVLNPKVTLFIVALFATVIDPATGSLVQVAYGLWMAAVTVGWFCVVSVLFTHEPVRRAFLRAGPWIDRAMGIVLLAFAGALAFATLR